VLLKIALEIGELGLVGRHFGQQLVGLLERSRTVASTLFYQSQVIAVICEFLIDETRVGVLEHQLFDRRSLQQERFLGRI